MTQRLRVLAAPAEDQSLVPSSTLGGSQPPVSPPPGYDSRFWPPRASAPKCHTHSALRYTLSHAHKQKSKEILKVKAMVLFIFP